MLKFVNDKYTHTHTHTPTHTHPHTYTHTPTHPQRSELVYKSSDAVAEA